ncbi:MAG: hypothetical protein NPIRA01_38830 [Nitrospirales bacterium]|nr:MAG: hypothetical protein NPIRA01_38830 [Nitrospirales bacterium]
MERSIDYGVRNAREITPKKRKASAKSKTSENENRVKSSEENSKTPTSQLH